MVINHLNYSIVTGTTVVAMSGRKRNDCLGQAIVVQSLVLAWTKSSLSSESKSKFVINCRATHRYVQFQHIFKQEDGGKNVPMFSSFVLQPVVLCVLVI